MSALLHDIRFAARMLRRKPGFTLAAAAALALGIGPTTAIFSIVYATLLAPLPFPQPEELMMVWSQGPQGRAPVSLGDFLQLKKAKSFDGLIAWQPRNFNLATPEEPITVRTQVVTPGRQAMLGETVRLGREFLPEEAEPGKDRVVILTHRLWEERFGSDRDIIGRQVRMNSEPYTVVGVLAAGPADRLPAKMFVPFAYKPDDVNHGVRRLLVKGRLKDGVSVQQAQSEMASIMGSLARQYPKSNQGWSASVEPLQNNFMAADRISNLWLLLAAVSFVLLIACVNVANLLLTRVSERSREIALRASLGAGRMRLFTHVLTESLVLAVLGAALGLFLAEALMRVVIAIMPPFTLPSEADPQLNMPVLLFTLAASVISGVLFGCAPAWDAARLDLTEALKDGGRTSTSGGRRGLRRALVTVEFALAVTLLAGAGMTIQSFRNRMHVDLGIRTENVLTFYLPVQPARLPGAAQIDSFYRSFLDKVVAVPGVVDAGVALNLPLNGSPSVPVNIAGRRDGDSTSKMFTRYQPVSGGYLSALGVRVLRGRPITDQDTAASVRVAMINERFAQSYLAGADPLRERLLLGRGSMEFRIVGVFSNVSNADQLGNPDDPEVFVPFWQDPAPQAAVAVRAAGDPSALRKSIAGLVRDMDPDLPMSEVRTMERVVSERMAGEQFQVALYTAMALFALLLAALGIYSVMNFLVVQRTPEIGLRMALGADRQTLLAQLLAEGLKLALGGLVLGAGGAYAIGRILQSRLYGTGALDIGVFLAVSTLLLSAAIAACYFPARRASSVDPLIALRHQ